MLLFSSSVLSKKIMLLENICDRARFRFDSLSLGLYITSAGRIIGSVSRFSCACRILSFSSRSALLGNRRTWAVSVLVFSSIFTRGSTKLFMEYVSHKWVCSSMLSEGMFILLSIVKKVFLSKINRWLMEKLIFKYILYFFI